MRRCKFCNKPILSDGCYKVYNYVNNFAIDRKYKAVSSKDIAKKLNMSIQVTDNYLLKLFDLDLVRRERTKDGYLYI